jgi:hypothetical protein
MSFIIESVSPSFSYFHYKIVNQIDERGRIAASAQVEVEGVELAAVA